jgi:thiol:disulfide interchange protein
MNATLSTRQLRLVVLAVVGVVAVGGYLVVSKHKASTTASSTPSLTTPASTTHAVTTPTPSKTHPATHAGLNTHGLPPAVARALQKHSVVVVTLTTPRGQDDVVVRAEAQAGAAEMHAGFVSIDVFHQQPGTQMLRKLGVVDTPVTLVIKRPANIVSQFPGLVDRDVVAQAVENAHH